MLGIYLISCNQDKPDTLQSGISQEWPVPDHHSLKPDSLTPQQTIRLKYEDLEAVFADNSSYGQVHRAGYNGISELRHSLQDSNLFVPFYAGFNLEHIFGGDSLIQLFEPRLHPMELFRISDHEVLLYQSPTPLSYVESQTRFKLTAPHYIDISFRFIIHDGDFFEHGYAGLFWASYINCPSDRSIYFLGKAKGQSPVKWIRAFSAEHGIESTHTWIQDTSALYFAPEFNARLASHFSNYLYEAPYFYGRFHQMVLAFFFDRAEGIRFSQSPTGGGEFSPAWDFQYIVPQFTTGREYSFRVRMVYKKWAGREDIVNEYSQWVSRLGAKP
jgi:hypothetical protein